MTEEFFIDRPKAHIFCVVCDENCISAEDSKEKRKVLSQQLQEITKVAIAKVKKMDSRLHYTFLHVRLDI